MPPSQSPRLLGAGLWTAAAGVALSLLCVLLALPPFRLGVWSRATSVVSGVHLASALAAAGLVMLLRARPGWILRFLRHPYTLSAAAVAALSALLSPLTPMPMLSWLGLPALGEGIVWYLDLSVLIAAAMAVYRWRAARRIVWTAGAAGTGLAFGLSLLSGHRSEWAPYWFYDHLAFFGLFLPVVLYTHLGGPRRRRALISVTAGAALVAFSENRAALVLYAVLGPALWILFRHLASRPRQARAAAAATVLVIPLAAILAVYALGSQLVAVRGWTQQQVQAGEPLAGLSPAASEAVLERGVLPVAATLWSRMMLLEVVHNAVRHEPGLLVTGAGWGGFSDTLLAYAPLEQVSLVPGTGQGVTWDALIRIDFHSHNFLAQGLLAAGVPGVLLAWALAAVLPLAARRPLIPVAATVAAVTAGLSSLWFQLPGSLPFMALAYAGLARPGPRRAPGPVRRNAAVLVLIAVALIQLLAAASVLYSSAQAGRLEGAELPASQQGCTGLLQDFGRGGHQLARLLLAEVGALKIDIGKGVAPSVQNVRRLDSLLCAADELAAHQRDSLRLAVAGIIARAELAWTLPDGALDAVRDRYLASWGARLRQVLERAPARTDLATTYLLWLLDAGKEAEMRSLSDWILARHPADPVGLWFSGLALLGRPGHAHDGMLRLRRSLEHGIERRMPIEPEWKAQISAYPTQEAPSRSSPR